MYVLRLHILSTLLLKAHAIKEHNASIRFQNNVVDWSTFCFLCSSQCSASYPQHSQPSSWTSFGSTRTTNFCFDDSDSAGTRNLASSNQLPCLSSVTFSCRFNAFARFLFPQGLIKIFREKKHIRFLYLQWPDDAPLLFMMKKHMWLLSLQTIQKKIYITTTI